MVDINKKRWTKLLYSSLWILLLVGFISSLSDLKEEVQTFVFGKNNSVVEEKYSPNGRYKAVKFERNMGATTSTNYHISIILANDELGNDVGNVYGAETEFGFEWSGNNTLIIKNSSKDSFFIKEKWVKGVRILYQ